MAAVLSVLAAVAVWKFHPALVAAAPGLFSNTPQFPNFSEQLKGADQAGASFIKRLAAGEVKPLEALPKQLPASMVEATISATLSTTPERMWEAYQSEGVVGAASELGSTAKFQAGNVSTAVAEEARYQYCLGVVESYQSKKTNN